MDNDQTVNIGEGDPADLLHGFDDPTKVLGRLAQPPVVPQGDEREGNLPKVVHNYCLLIRGRELILPDTMSDKAPTTVSVELEKMASARGVSPN